MSATIIESLAVLVGLDASGHKQGALQVEKDQEGVRNAAEKTENELKEHGKKAGEFFDTLKEAAVAFFAVMAGAELKEFGEQTIKANAEALELAETLGVDVEQLERYQAAAELRGGNAEGFTASLKGLNENLVAIEKHLPRFKRSLVIFGAAGLSEAELKGKGLFDVLGMLADKFQGLSGAEGLALGQRMGLDEATIRLLREGREEVEKLADSTKDLVATREEAEQSLKAEHAFAKLRLEGRRLGQTLLTMAMPAIMKVADALDRLLGFARAHPDGMKALFLSMAAGIAAVGLAAGAMALATIEISGPLLLLGLLVAALTAGFIYLREEYQKWLIGGDSRFGQLFEFFDTLMGMLDQLRGVWDSTFSGIWDLVKQYFNLFLDQFELVFAILSGDPQKMAKAWEKWGEDSVAFFEGALKLMVYLLFVALQTMLSAWIDAWDSMGNFAARAIEGALGKLKDFARYLGGATTLGGNLNVAYASATPSTASPYSSSSMSADNRDQSRSVHIDTVNVQTQATDARGVAREIGEGAVSRWIVQMSDGAM